jgi:pimeloyl-ACP methyl ester carboxylesterase
VTPLFIGTRERRIFALHDPAAAAGGPPRAAVLCNPWGTEYVHAHRTLRQLALKLALLGYHTLRFDYFGTGDSAGEVAQVDLAGMQSDAESAIEAVKDIAGARQVALIGLRMGANVAAQTAVTNYDDIETLVLWDPITSPVGIPMQPTIAARTLTLVTAGVEARVDAAGGAGGGVGPGGGVRAGDGVGPGAGVGARGDVGAGVGVELDVGTIPMERIEAPCPWIESATTTGALPVRVFQRIEQWLRTRSSAAMARPAIERATG